MTRFWVAPSVRNLSQRIGQVNHSMDEYTISVVIPVYRGADTLPDLIEELAQFRRASTTPDGRSFIIDEVLLVWDQGPDESDRIIRELDATYSWVRPVWLSRNFGQHAATLAGMSSSAGNWIVTMDEDGQNDPSFIGAMLDTAFVEHAQLVYARPTNRPPHGWFRNTASAATKRLFQHVLSDGKLPTFSSYRLISGEIARSVAAYVGPGVFLDVALSWVVARVSITPVRARIEGRDATSYNLRSLISHFWRMVISSGTRPLRLVTGLGFLCGGVAVVVAAWAIIERLGGAVNVTGWASTFVAILFVGGAVLVALGVIAEYIAMATSLSMGKPVFLIVGDPERPFLHTERPPRG